MKLLIVISLSVISGCYFQASITDLNPKSESPNNKADATQTTDFVSGSDQYQTTLLNRYRILSSSGSYHRELVNKTPKGYKVYSSVQGALISSQAGVQ